MKLLKPPKLNAGDVVGIISPSEPIFSKRDLSRGMKALESLGLKPRLSRHALDVHKNYLAGNRKDRVRDLEEMFLDDEVRAIFCTNGGYASIQLLPELDFRMIAEHPKILIGYSDITTLLNAIHLKTGLVTFHGPVVEDLGMTSKRDKFSLSHMKSVLMKNAKAARLPSYTDWKVLREGRAEGELIGGNLNVLLSLMGTPYEPDFTGKILFIEEDSETVEGLDNYLWRLRVAKIFKKIEGLVIGKITNVQSLEGSETVYADIEKPPTMEDVILESTEGFNFPILYGVDFGHEVASLTLPLGVKASLDCGTLHRIGSFSLLDSCIDSGEKDLSSSNEKKT